MTSDPLLISGGGRTPAQGRQTPEPQTGYWVLFLKDKFHLRKPHFLIVFDQTNPCGQSGDSKSVASSGMLEAGLCLWLRTPAFLLPSSVPPLSKALSSTCRHW